MRPVLAPLTAILIALAMVVSPSAATSAATEGAQEPGEELVVFVPRGWYYSFEMVGEQISLTAVPELFSPAPANHPPGQAATCFGVAGSVFHYLSASPAVALGELGQCASQDHTTRITQVTVVAARGMTLVVYDRQSPAVFSVTCVPYGAYTSGTQFSCSINSDANVGAFNLWMARFTNNFVGATYARIS